jgi:hypothetical protein
MLNMPQAEKKAIAGVRWISRKEMNSIVAKRARAVLNVSAATDLPPISHPLITGVSRFWFCFEIISQPS